MDFSEAKEQMVQGQLISRGIQSPEILAAMRKVPRHLFVDEIFQAEAYGDHPIPLEAGQTISQPYMVALMTELLEPKADSRVLEIGTGSGYQAAILAELVKQVYTIERLSQLAGKAAAIFEQLAYHNVELCVGDGTVGWEAHAPYDGILVTAGAPSVPDALIGQLANHGKLVIPVGNRISQVLQIITKHDDQITTQTSCHCVFVKLLGKHGWKN